MHTAVSAGKVDGSCQLLSVSLKYRCKQEKLQSVAAKTRPLKPRVSK